MPDRLSDLVFRPTTVPAPEGPPDEDHAETLREELAKVRLRSGAPRVIPADEASGRARQPTG
jgi:hypothetical protein